MCYHISNILFNNTGDTPVNDKVSTYYKEIKCVCLATNLPLSSDDPTVIV